MDSFVKEMLELLNLNHLGDLFNDQCTDREVFRTLNDTDFREFLPNIGYRKKISNYVNETIFQSPVNTTIPNLAQ